MDRKCTADEAQAARTQRGARVAECMAHIIRGVTLI